MWDQNYSNYIIFLYFPLGNLPIGNKILLSEQTTHNVASIISEIPIREKNYLPNSRGSFFLFLGCISYTKLVNIMSLFGTHQKENPYWEKGSDEVLVSFLCSFLYILDMTVISQGVLEERMYKKCMFYTYVFKEKYST